MTSSLETSKPKTGATSTGRDSVSLLKFWQPRHWPTWMLVLWLRFAAALPWRASIKLHKRIGRVAGALLQRRRRIVRRNIEICFPHLPQSEVQALVVRHFENIGAFIAELGFAWFASAERLAPLFRVEGTEHIQAALAGGKGAIFYSGHFTPLEICVPVIKAQVPLFAFMFRTRSNPLLSEMQSRGRRRAAHVSVANDDVRAMLRVLARNAAVFYAPDQAARIDNGVLLPFFGEPCVMSTATSRLARHTGAAVLPVLYYRLPDDSGYLIRFYPLLADFPSDDAVHDTQRLSLVLEDFVRECPDQYLWTHRKFKDRPSTLEDAYEPTGTG